MGTPIRHPLIDEITERVALVESRARVIRLSPALADLLARPVALGRTLVLLTPESSRVTIGLRSALVAARAVWAVVTADGYRDGITGIDHHTLDEAAAGHAPDIEPSADFDGLPPSISAASEVTTQLSVDVTLLHRATHDTLLGGAVESISAAIGGYRPLAWGLSEPLEKSWDRWVLTQDARHRAPDPTRIIVEGEHVSAAVTTRVTDRGLEETVALTADVPGGRAGLDAAIERLRAALGDLTRTSLPTFALVLAREGEADRSFRPVTYPPPNPVVLLIGAPSVRRLDLGENTFAPSQDVDVVGRPTLPAFLLPLGSADRSGWEALHDALDSVGSERLTTLVDEPLLDAWEGDLHEDIDRHGDPHPHDHPDTGGDASERLDYRDDRDGLDDGGDA
ncbi:hypothetical protein AX769_18360 [Frondihabitans sp. PAMC 28766]|uniref:DUF6177 family protein n=1 Tax=Frondihabitans sp. PAMC 28766 TaxID=1795630 RepID=UPI00078CBE52|nr:DUF6177 family protein [Frondihabitans sp. PAMC 28766]AMM21750.1 hypothetical protein AX769_18360 [Frondihabitans sp. PAMC 28766]